MQLIELTIDDTSPLIFYSPFRDTLSTPNLSSGWNPYYNISGFATPRGIGQSYHITSMDGASLSVKWNGNGIRLLGNTTSCSFTLTLDNTDFQPNAAPPPNSTTLVDISNLQYGVHTLTLTTRIPQTQTPRNASFCIFDGAVIKTVALDSLAESIYRQYPLDRDSVSFNGRWSVEPASSPDQTFHTSNTTGDRASTTFHGTAFILQGMTNPEAGNYSVTLDGVTTSLSAQSSFTVANTTLFFATGLNDSVLHSVEVTNNGGKLSLLENGFLTVAALGPDRPPPDSLATTKSEASFSAGTVAAFALAGVLFAILAIVGLFLFWRKRGRRRNNIPHPTTWNDKTYVVRNSKPGYGGSFRNSWRFKRQTRASSDFGSYGAKGDTMTLESGVAGGHLEGQSSRNEFSGTSQGISLPILFRHSAEFVPEAKRHPYSVYDPISNLDKSAEMKKGSSSPQPDIDRTSVALANLKNKGKARQITGSTMEDSLFESSSRQSFSPNDLLQGLHVRISGGKNFSRMTSQGSVSLSLNPSTSPVPGQGRNSFLSTFHAASNASTCRESHQSQSTTSPTETLPSVPRSVSVANSNTIIPRESGRRYLLDDQTELEDLDNGEPPHAYRYQGTGVQNIPPNSLSRQVIRSLSPRISEMRTEGDRDNADYFYPETLAEEPSTLEGDHLLTVMAPSTPSGRDSLSSLRYGRNMSSSLVPFLPPVPPSETPNDNQMETDTTSLSTPAKLDRPKLSPTLPSLKRTSPFDIRFDWQSERQSKRASDSSRLRVPGQRDSEDLVQGPSRNRFRLTPLTMAHSRSVNSSAPSQASTEVITSFLDFTNSSEDSSPRTNSFSAQFGSRIFGASDSSSSSQLAKGGRMAELKSRWSDTTSSIRRRDSSREPSSSTDKSSRRKTYHTSTIPSIYVTSEVRSTKAPAQRQSDSTQFSTENPTHVHPSISDTGSHRDSLSSQRAPLDTGLIRTVSGGSDESSGAAASSRWTSSESSNQFHTRLLLASTRYPPLPEGTEYELSLHPSPS